MIKLIRKVFIKDYQNVKDPKVRYKHASLASVGGLILNLVLVALKLIFGILANSISIIADGINNLADGISSVIAYISIRLSNRPPDKEHPFGHQRGEYIAYLIVSIVMIVVGIELFRSSILKIIDNGTVKYTLLSLNVLFIAVVVKIAQGFFYRNISILIDSLPLKGASKDSFIDVLATLVIIVGGVIYIAFGINVDGYLGILVSVLIVWTAYTMIKEAISPLLGTKADATFITSLLKDVKSFPGVLGVHDVVCHTYGPSHIFTTLHVEVDSELGFMNAHELIDSIEESLAAKYSTELVIHMDPIDVNCPVTQELKQRVSIALEAIDENISFHDFRIVKNLASTNIIFDIALPLGAKVTEAEIIAYLEESFRGNKKYHFKIHFDLLHEDN